jgi:ATP-dependent helicase HrpA
MPSTSVHEIEQAIHKAVAGDRFRFRRRLRTLRSKGTSNQIDPKELERLRGQVEESVQRRAAREAALPVIHYLDALPILAKRDEISAAIRQHQVVIVCGETGSGKSTQLPKICLEMGRGVDGFIGHTQPRRLAARSIATRLAEELKSPLGTTVGFKIRFTDRTSPNSFVKLMTDGILLAETQSDRFLNHYDTIILDEAHERSLNIDFLLGYIKRLLPKRPELRLIITSATIDAERFSEHFASTDGPAPVIEVSGRSYPVEVWYRGVDDDDQGEGELDAAVVHAVGELIAERSGDVLVFLPTERDIREISKTLSGWARHQPSPLEILPLYARLPAKEQNRVFQAHPHRRVVLATNVAESSLTVPNILGVVDTGTARISRYSPRSKVQRLPIEPVSQASADQRKGRCGRVAPGICIRLFSEDDFASRDQYTTPEIRRTNLASVILQTMALKLGAIEEFPFLDPPRSEAIRDGYKTLFELGAIDAHRKLTPLGRELSRLPVDPRIGRMILAADQENCLDEVLIIASALEVMDARQRPADKQQAADERHAQFADESSDFIGYLKLWDFYHHLKGTLSRNQLRKACRTNFLSLTRLREWADVYRQLRQIVETNQRRLSPRQDDYDSIHRALLAGLLSGIAFRTETYEYTAAGEIKTHLWPGSGLFEKRPKWIVAAELVETSRRYSRVVARVNPDWIEPLAKHLVKKSYSEPHWDQRRQCGMVFQRVSLFGLPIVPRRRVQLGPVDSDAARQLFIQHGLVEGQLSGNFAFLKHNRQLLGDVESMAAKGRRSDWIVGEQALVEFYDSRVDADVYDAPRLRSWLNKKEAGNKDLHLRLEDLLPDAPPDDIGAQFPDRFPVGPCQFPLDYCFEPGNENDGVVMTVPQSVINQVPPQEVDWLVPGRLEEKITALIRSLPKSIRRGLVPAPDTARKAVGLLHFGDGPFLPTLAEVLTRISGEPVSADAFRLDRLPNHLVLKVRVVDDQGKTLAVDGDLDRLTQQLGTQTDETKGQIQDTNWQLDDIRAWDFADLPKQVMLRRSGMQVPAYPALIDEGDHVRLRLVDTADRAAEQSRAGVRRLYYLKQRKFLLAHVAWLPRLNEIKLLASSLRGVGHLEASIAELICDRAFVRDGPLPRTRDEFQQRLKDDAERGNLAVQDVAKMLFPLFETYHAARLAWEQLAKPRWQDVADDVEGQLEALVAPGFLTNTLWTWLEQFPRYFRAIESRLDKLKHGAQQRDQVGMAELVPWLEAYQDRAQRHEQRGLVDKELVLFRWMLEEFRVSLFAQQLGTIFSISSNRLEKQWAKVQV